VESDWLARTAKSRRWGKETVAEIRWRLQAMGGAKLERRLDGSVGIVDSNTWEPTEGRTLLAAVLALLDREEQAWYKEKPRG
jgi:hypothetical protein